MCKLFKAILLLFITNIQKTIKKNHVVPMGRILHKWKHTFNIYLMNKMKSSL